MVSVTAVLVFFDFRLNLLSQRHLLVDGIADKAVQALALTGGKVLDLLPLTFGNRNRPSVASILP